MTTARIKPVTLGRRVAKYLMQSRYLSSAHKPLLRRRAARNYALYVATGSPPLRFCDLALTYDCTMACAHCSAARLSDPTGAVMSVDEYGRLSEQLVENGVIAIQLTGGEPLLRDDIDQVIRALAPERTFISVVTNSALASRDRLLGMRAAGLDNVCVSLDSADPEQHDSFRGTDGNHERALRALDCALEIGLTAMVFHVVTHSGLRSGGLTRLIEATGRRGVLLVLGWAAPTGSWNANLEVLLDDEDLLYLEAIHERYPHVRTDFETNYFDWGCGAVKEKLYVSAYGDVLPCAFVHVRLGNVREQRLEEIRSNAMRVEWFREYNGRCLAATDHEFRERHLSRIFAAPREPVSLAEAGLLPDDDRAR